MLNKDTSFANARGSKEGFILMVELKDGNSESIGGEIPNKEDMLKFMESFKTKKDFEEFMPDSDYNDIVRVYID